MPVRRHRLDRRTRDGRLIALVLIGLARTSTAQPIADPPATPAASPWRISCSEKPAERTLVCFADQKALSISITSASPEVMVLVGRPLRRGSAIFLQVDDNPGFGAWQPAFGPERSALLLKQMLKGRRAVIEYVPRARGPAVREDIDLMGLTRAWTEVRRRIAGHRTD
jgi:hypothetical protein